MSTPLNLPQFMDQVEDLLAHQQVKAAEKMVAEHQDLVVQLWDTMAQQPQSKYRKLCEFLFVSCDPAGANQSHIEAAMESIFQKECQALDQQIAQSQGNVAQVAAALKKVPAQVLCHFLLRPDQALLHQVMAHDPTVFEPLLTYAPYTVKTLLAPGLLTADERVKLLGKDGTRNNVLQQAALDGKTKVVEALYAMTTPAEHALFQITGDNHFYLWTALRFNHPEALRVFIAISTPEQRTKFFGGDEDYASCLNEAIKYGQAAIMETLLDLATPEERTQLMQGKEGYTPMHEAADQGKPAVIDQLLKLTTPAEHVQLMKADHAGNTPLHIAAHMGNVAVISKLLTDATAEDDLSLRSSLLAPNRRGRTPLHMAVVTGNLGFMQKLLERVSTAEFVSLMSKDGTGSTPLHLAVISQSDKVIKCLLTQADSSYNPEVRAQCFAGDAAGNTPLHLACIIRSMRSLETLFAETDATIQQRRDSKGKTFLAYLVSDFSKNDAKKFLQNKVLTVELQTALLDAWLNARHTDEAQTLLAKLWQNKQSFLFHSTSYPAIMRFLQEEKPAELDADDMAQLPLEQRLRLLPLLSPTLICKTVTEMPAATLEQVLTPPLWNGEHLPVAEALTRVYAYMLRQQAEGASDVATLRYIIREFIAQLSPLTLAVSTQRQPDCVSAFLAYCEPQQVATIVPHLPAEQLAAGIKQLPLAGWPRFINAATATQKEALLQLLPWPPAYAAAWQAQRLAWTQLPEAERTADAAATYANLASARLRTGSTNLVLEKSITDTFQKREQSPQLQARLTHALAITEAVRIRTVERIEAWYKAQMTGAVDIPEEFIDPITADIMTEPMQFPVMSENASPYIVDKSTLPYLKQNAAGAYENPSNRAWVPLADILPATELQERIDQWQKAPKSAPPRTPPLG